MNRGAVVMAIAGASRRSAVSVLYGVDARQSTSDVVEPVSEASTVKALLNELFDATKDNKSQTVQDVRDKLNALREKLGDEKFKEILNKLIEEARGEWLEFLKRLLGQWFPDEVTPPAPPAPSSPRGGGGGGGGGGQVNPQDFGPSESMSDKPITEGANFYDYKPDNSNPGVKPDKGRGAGNIWSGFYQGSNGNCITVSAIKAAMMHFGKKPTDVFKSVKEAGDGYDVEMRDGVKVHLSKDELKQAALHARFRGDDPEMLTNANFMYAVSAKRAQKENNDGVAGRSFMAAMQSLNDGEYAREGLDRLGLRGHYRPATDADLKSSKVGTVEYGGHSMAVIDGRIEKWGRRGLAPESGTATVLI
ncbi:ANIS5 family metal-binding protein [Pseudomonas rhodesiae]|nr:ANIS5 family metal-binding protein [Pseudomonas rhodesiae]